MRSASRHGGERQSPILIPAAVHSKSYDCHRQPQSVTHRTPKLTKSTVQPIAIAHVMWYSLDGNRLYVWNWLGLIVGPQIREIIALPHDQHHLPQMGCLADFSGR